MKNEIRIVRGREDVAAVKFNEPTTEEGRLALVVEVFEAMTEALFDKEDFDVLSFEAVSRLTANSEEAA